MFVQHEYEDTFIILNLEKSRMHFALFSLCVKYQINNNIYSLFVFVKSHIRVFILGLVLAKGYCKWSSVDIYHK